MKKLLILSSVFLSMAFLSACEKQMTETEPSALDENPVLEDETSKLQTYVDPNNRFQFQYLSNGSDSQVASDGRETGLIFSLMKDGLEAMYGKFEEKDKIETSDCAEDLKNVGTITVGDVAVNKCLDETSSNWTVVIQNESPNDKVGVYTITCSGEHSDFEAYCEEVLSTFQFMQ